MFYKPKHEEAKATEHGWVSKKTGELLTSHKGLLSKLKNLGLDAEGNKIKKVMTQAESVEENKEDSKEKEVPEEKAPVRKRPAKRRTTKK